MAGALRRLAVFLPGKHLRLLGAVALLSMIGATAEFAMLVRRESAMVDRFADSSWWMASKFRDEIQALHISLALYDGSPSALDDLRARYDIVFGRIAAMQQAQLEPTPEPAFQEAFREVRSRILALEPRFNALQPGDAATIQDLTADMAELEQKSGHMTTLGAQEDAAHRGALRSAVERANVAFGLTAALLIASLLLALRAVIRQASVLDAARQRSEALSGELAVALAQAEAGARAKSAFLATMSHEIRTPMNGVLGAASLLTHTKLSGTQQRWVEIVKACGEALLAQLDDVLDFSALEAERIKLHPEPVDIRALLEGTARVVEGTAGQKGLDLVVTVDPDVPSAVVTDRRRLAQVLLNLMTNAIKFTSAGGVVARISLRRRGGTAWLRAAVIDTGPGVPRAERRRIFEEFTRLERAAELGARGTGLGLAISRRITSALHGALHVAAAPGGGSVFWLTIPVDIPAEATFRPRRPVFGTAAVIGGATPVRRALERLLIAEGYMVVPPTVTHVSLRLVHGTALGVAGPASARTFEFGAGTRLDGTLSGGRLHAALTGTAVATAEPATREGSARTLAPLRLLVADDDPINREIAASLLRHLGHIVTTASDGADALATAQARPFDCLLLDLQMPGLDGAELARALRRLPGPVASVRLLAVTADVDAGSRAAVMAAGFDAILTKPVTLERLAAALPRSPVTAEAPHADAPAAIDIVIDQSARGMLQTRLAPERFAALVRTFWEEMVRSLEHPAGFPGLDPERRLHSLTGSSASLGYNEVAAAARQCRIRLATPLDLQAALAVLRTAIAAALAADAALLPEPVVWRVHAALAASRSEPKLTNVEDSLPAPAGRPLSAAAMQSAP